MSLYLMLSYTQFTFTALCSQLKQAQNQRALSSQELSRKLGKRALIPLADMFKPPHCSVVYGHFDKQAREHVTLLYSRCIGICADMSF